MFFMFKCTGTSSIAFLFFFLDFPRISFICGQMSTAKQLLYSTILALQAIATRTKFCLFIVVCLWD